MRQLTRNGLEWLADHIGYMFKGHLRPVCRQMSHPKDQAILAQFLFDAEPHIIAFPVSFERPRLV